MEITFITNTDRHNVTYPTYHSDEMKGEILGRLDMYDRIQLDYETTGLDPYKDKLLLTSLNIGGKLYVIDNTTVSLTDIISSESLEGVTVISHHAKFEYKFSKTNGLQLGDMYCTMVAEQRLTQGTGLPCNLVDTCIRREVELPIGMDKDVRLSFIGADPDSIIFTDDQILYSASDVIPLEDIMYQQINFFLEYDMEFLINSIEMPLISVLGDMELEGFKHLSDKWIAYADKKEAEANELVKKLNQTALDYGIKLEEINPELIKKNQSKVSKIQRLQDRIDKLTAKLVDLENKDKTHTKQYTVTKETCTKCVSEWYELCNSEEVHEEVGINWNSGDQVLKVLSCLKGFKLPTAKDPKTKQMKPSVAKDARSVWFNENQDSPYLEFFTLFDKYQKIMHNVNSFGRKWVEQYTNPITGKVHCFFKQCQTETGRLASGDAKNGYFNGQQIPAIAELRECFVADEGYDLITIDLSSAELVVMSSLADDKHLYNLFVVYDDIHSSILTKAWRKIYKYRGNDDLAETFTVSKTENAHIRKKGKAGTFAVVYGAYASRLATTLDVSVKEAELYVEAVEEELLPTIEFVKSKSEEALREGFIVHNNRTNSRRWFPEVVEAQKYNRSLNFKQESAVVSAARNGAIQATQADMVKEAMVVIYRFNKANNLDVKFKLQVHDELVIQKPIGLEVLCPYTNKTVKFEDYVHKALTTIANLYLREGYTMGADYHVAPYWLK